MRELPPPDELNKPRDAAPIIYVPPSTYYCLFCAPSLGFKEDGEPEVVRTTVVWLGPHTDGPHGRCRECGQKYALADTYNPSHVPSPEEQGWT